MAKGGLQRNSWLIEDRKAEESMHVFAGTFRDRICADTYMHIITLHTMDSAI